MKINKTNIPSLSKSEAWWEMLKTITDPVVSLLKSLQKHGDFIITYLGPSKIYLTSNPDIIQHVLQTNNKNYHKSPIMGELMAKYVLGRSLPTLDGEEWLKQRRLIQPGFHKKKLESLMQIIQKQTILFEKEIPLGKVFEIESAMIGLTLSIVTKSLFSTAISRDEQIKVNNTFSSLQRFVRTQIKFPFLLPLFRIAGKVKYYEGMKRKMDDFINQIITKRKQENGEFGDLLEMLLEARYEDTGKGMTNLQLTHEALTLFFAGHETAATSLTWLWYLLAKHPRVEEKVLQEIKEILGEDGEISFDKINDLVYTNQVIQEALRLYSPAWGIDRVAVNDDVIKGQSIPKGSVVIISVGATHQNPAYWKDPTLFIPERFEKGKDIARQKFSYIPFGGGPRMCIGYNFAMMMLKIVLVSYIQKFRFSLEPNQKIKTEHLVTYHPKNGILMRAERREA